MLKIKLPRLLLLQMCVLILSISSTGCAGVNRYYLVAVPVANSEGTGITKRGVIELDSLTIILRPSYRIDIGYDHTYYKPNQYGFQVRSYKEWEISARPPKFFYIDVLIKPNVANIAFDPTKVVLISKNGERILASGYEGPLAVNSRRTYALGLCKARSPIDSSWPKLTLYIGKDYCFAFRFDIPPTADAEFSLELNGISFGEREIHIPVIRYITETIVTYES